MFQQESDTLSEEEFSNLVNAIPISTYSVYC